MSREKLEGMTGKELVAYADKLGVKVNANKERNGLKESKKTAIDKIIRYEEEHEPAKKQVKNKIDDILPDVLRTLDNYITKVYPSNRNYIIVKTKGDKPKRIGEVDVLRNKITFYSKRHIPSIPENILYKGFVNSSLGHCYHIPYTDDYLGALLTLINEGV